MAIERGFVDIDVVPICLIEWPLKSPSLFRTLRRIKAATLLAAMAAAFAVSAPAIKASDAGTAGAVAESDVAAGSPAG